MGEHRVRRTLIVTVGETPQVVTETLHALLTRSPPWPPDRILLATTGNNGERLARGDTRRGTAALTGPAGKLRELYVSLGFEAAYVEPELHLARLPSGALIDDVRSEGEVAAFADMLLELVRGATSEEGGQLHLSLAGGRKSMSFIAGQVMSLYGRAGDVLSHVLIEPKAFEFLNGFWWPGQPESELRNDRGAVLRPKDARVVLHQVPFIRLRAHLPDDEAFQSGAAPTYDAAVQWANEALAIDRLIIDLPDGRVQVGRDSVKVDPKHMAAAAVLAYAASRGASLQTLTKEGVRDAKFSGTEDDFLMVWSSFRVLAASCASTSAGEELRDNPLALQRERQRMAAQFDFNNDIAQPVSRLRREVRATFPRALADRIIARREFKTNFAAANIEILVPPHARELADLKLA